MAVPPGILGSVNAAALAEVTGHGLHFALFGAGLVSVGALLWVSRPRRPVPTREDERARVDE